MCRKECSNGGSEVCGDSSGSTRGTRPRSFAVGILGSVWHGSASSLRDAHKIVLPEARPPSLLLDPVCSWSLERLSQVCIFRLLGFAQLGDWVSRRFTRPAWTGEQGIASEVLVGEGFVVGWRRWEEGVCEGQPV